MKILVVSQFLVLGSACSSTEQQAGWTDGSEVDASVDGGSGLDGRTDTSGQSDSSTPDAPGDVVNLPDGGADPIDCSTTPCYYIREGGQGVGTDWQDAYPDLPASLERGAVYFVAAGSYDSHTFEDPEDGDRFIEVRRATETDHGTDTGWQAAYGAGPARFLGTGGTWSFERGYYRVDGRVGSGKSGYGFVVTTTDNVGTEVIRIGGEYSPDPGFVVLAHVEAYQPDVESCYGQNECLVNDIVYGAYGAHDVTLHQCYLHGSSWHAAVYMQGWTDCIIDHCTIENAYRKEGISARGSSHITVSNNVWENVAGTGIIVFEDADDWRIYNNVFITTNSLYDTTDCLICNWINKPMFATNIKVIGNTFVDLLPATRIHFEEGTGNEVLNNIFYGADGISFSESTLSHDYNWCGGQSCSAIGGEPHGQTGTSDIFVDYGAHDFRLASPTEPGTVLGPPYDRDMNGDLRGEDGVWDRGAMEY